MNPTNTTQGGEGSALPGRSVLNAPPAVARIWNYRRRIELEAADQFARLAAQMKKIGVHDDIARLARNASKDENRHATLCEKILTFLGTNLERQTPQLGVVLGPRELSARRRALYASVSLCAVTETLSTALLIEMQKKAEYPIIERTVHSILEDEITHSRIGWAHLAWESSSESVDWISRYVPQMLEEAIVSDVPSMVVPKGTPADLSSWGILPRAEAKNIMLKTALDIILPGLATFGIETAEARSYAIKMFA